MKWQEGEFKANPLGAVLGKASTGTDSVELIFGVYDGDQMVFERSGYVYLTPAAFDRAIATLRTCGWVGDDLADLSSIGANDQLFVRLTVKEDTYNGKQKPKIAFIDPWREKAPPLDPVEAKKFAEVMREKVRAADERNKQKAPAQESKAPF